MEFNASIKDEDALVALYGPINKNSLAKETDHLTDAYQTWIERAPFMAVASIGEGGLDCSPRGDKVGQLFRVIDKRTIAIPDRRGNNRLDTLRNLVGDSRISLLFLTPGINESLRINGDALVVTDRQLCESFTINGKAPLSVIVVSIKSVYFQCARALMRSELWSVDAHIAKGELPTAGEMTKSALPEFDAQSYDEALPGRQRDSMY